MATYKEFHQYSIEKPNEFWTEQAQLVDWKEPFTQVCDYSRPPFAKWFVGGKTNLCHNAVDRHAAKRPNDRESRPLRSRHPSKFAVDFNYGAVPRKPFNPRPAWSLRRRHARCADQAGKRLRSENHVILRFFS